MGLQKNFMLLWLAVFLLSTTGAYAAFWSDLLGNEPAITLGLDCLQAARISKSPNVFNVKDFGAKGDGTDDLQAFLKAWEKACSTAAATLVVPKNKDYLLKPVTFSGPCKASITMKIFGTIQASADRSDYEQDRSHWLMFQNVDNLRVEGGGTINGNEKIWWENSCKINKALLISESLVIRLCV